MRVERVLASLVLGLLAALSLALPTRADEQSTALGALTVRVRDPWPELLNRGAYPLFVEIENPTDEARNVEIEIHSGFAGSSALVSLEIGVAARGRATREVFVPVASYVGGMRVETRHGGQRASLHGLGPTVPPNHNVRVLVHSAADRPAAGFDAQVQAALSDEARPRHTEVETPGGIFIGMPPAPGTAPEFAQVEFVPHEDLATRLEAYTSLDAFVVDVSRGAPPDAALEAAFAWGRLGGVVAIVGAGARSFVEGSRALAPWAEPRFVLSAESVDDTADAPWDVVVAPPGVHRFVFGQGLLVVAEQALDAAAVHAALNAAIEGTVPWTPNAQPGRGARGNGAALPMEGLDPPYRALTALLLVFALVVGPLNFWYVKRAKRPALLLVTVPVIALVFSLVIFVFGAAAQGLDVRATSASFALLDQRLHKSSTAEARLLFAGLSAGEGWRFGPGASCLGSAPHAEVWNAQRQLRLEFDDGVVFAGDYLPVRTPTEQVFVVDRAARERVEFERASDHVTAVNGLGTTVEHLVLHDFDGTRWRSSSTIAPGASARLERVGADDPALEGQLEAAMQRTFAVASAGALAKLPRGAYAAELATSPFLDAGGIDFEERAHAHFVAGILERSGDAR